MIYRPIWAPVVAIVTIMGKLLLIRYFFCIFINGRVRYLFI